MPPKSKRASSRGRSSSRGQREASSSSQEVVTITAEVRSPPVEIKDGQNEDTITENDVLGTLQEKVKESEAILKGLVQPPAVTPESTFANYVRDSLLTMSSLKFKKARASINKILTRLMDEDSEEEEEDLPTFWAICRSAPFLASPPPGKPRATCCSRTLASGMTTRPLAFLGSHRTGSGWADITINSLTRPSSSLRRPSSSHTPTTSCHGSSSNRVNRVGILPFSTRHHHLCLGLYGHQFCKTRHGPEQQRQQLSSLVVTCAAMDVTVFPTEVSTAALLSNLNRWSNKKRLTFHSLGAVSLDSISSIGK